MNDLSPRDRELVAVSNSRLKSSHWRSSSSQPSARFGKSGQSGSGANREPLAETNQARRPRVSSQ
jgi:hypothetical protein